jgi:hypothetical protein
MLKKSCFIRTAPIALAILLSLSFSPSATGADKTLVLLPLVIYSEQPKDFLRPGLKSMLVSRLSGEGIQIISDEKLYPLLSEKEKQGVNSSQRAEEIAKALKADFAVFGSLTSIGTGYSLDLSVLDLTKEQPKLTRISEAVPEDQLIPRLSDIAYDIRAVISGIDLRPQKKEGPPAGPESVMGLFYKPGAVGREMTPAGRVPAKMGVMSCDAGDLKGDGQVELLVLGQDRLLVYGRKEGSMALLDTLKSGLGEDFFKVSAADVDGNGKAEIYLVSAIGLRAESSIWEWNGKFRRILKTAGHLQAVKVGDAKPLLIFQDSLVGQFFSGRIAVMTFNGAALTQQEVLPEFGEGIQFYTLAPLDPRRKQAAGYVGLTRDSYIGLWDGSGTLVWRSEEKVGGTNNLIIPARYFDKDELIPIYINPRILVGDINHDGKNEVLVIDNIPAGKYTKFMKTIEKSNIVIYRVEPGSLVPVLKSPKISYCLTDMQVEGKTLYLAAQRGKMVQFGEGSGSVIWFE